MTADEVIQRLHLEPHPKEGGFFRETWRSTGVSNPGAPFDGERSHGTAIYYLLTPDTFSAMHRLPGDEIFHFYLGDPVQMLELHPDGTSRITILGPGLEDMTVQHVVAGGTWQGSRLIEGGQWALLGCTVSPGFDYADYESGTASLLDEYSAHRELVRGLLIDP